MDLALAQTLAHHFRYRLKLPIQYFMYTVGQTDALKAIDSVGNCQLSGYA